MDQNWKETDTYFDELPPAPFDELLKGINYPWEALAKLDKVFEHFFSDLLSTIYSYLYCVEKEPDGGVHVIKSKKLTSPLVDKAQKIYIGEGTLIETGATIKPNTVILNDCEVRQSSYLRGNIFVDSLSILGHTTEIKNAILLKHVEAGHFVYVGDSIVGSYVNLGAGSKLSNLRFRTIENKKKGHFPILDLKYGDEKPEHSLSKFGALISDGCELGCNSVTAPGVLLGKSSWVYPTAFVQKGFYPPHSVLKNKPVEYL